MKYRYVLKNKHTGEIHFKRYALETIERAGLSKLFDVENYEIISRDRFTELKDKNGVDVYEGDLINVGYNYLGVKEVKFIEGKFDISVFNLNRCEITGNIHQPVISKTETTPTSKDSLQVEGSK